ncbi:MAG TPA: hypothetical protein VFB58_18855 [Chloroflexota bacterium]|nr:hypothetical protein [Chloroflexota bacterium]
MSGPGNTRDERNEHAPVVTHDGASPIQGKFSGREHWLLRRLRILALVVFCVYWYTYTACCLATDLLPWHGWTLWLRLFLVLVLTGIVVAEMHDWIRHRVRSRAR